MEETQELKRLVMEIYGGSKLSENFYRLLGPGEGSLPVFLRVFETGTLAYSVVCDATEIPGEKILDAISGKNTNCFGLKLIEQSYCLASLFSNKLLIQCEKELEILLSIPVRTKALRDELWPEKRVSRTR